MSSPLKIMFVGKNGAKPRRTITDGNDTITLPEDQSKPFAHEKAQAILRHAPHLYKKVVRPKKRKVVRSSVTGRFVSLQQAKDNKRETITQTVNVCNK